MWIYGVCVAAIAVTLVVLKLVIEPGQTNRFRVQVMKALREGELTEGRLTDRTRGRLSSRRAIELLRDMELDRLIQSRLSSGDRPARLYVLTALGQEQAAQLPPV